MSRTLDQMARERTEKALGVIDEVMTDPFAENKDRLKAAIEMLDRGHGKPLSATISVPLQRQKQAQLSKMTDADLMAHLQSQPLPTLLSLPTPDAEFTDITEQSNVEHAIANHEIEDSAAPSEFDNPMLA